MSVRFPLASLREDAMPGLRWTVGLYKRRRRCDVCGHRHGPNRNRDAIACAHHVTGGRCGCRAMLDWKLDRWWKDATP